MLHDAATASNLASALHRIIAASTSSANCWSVEDLRVAIRIVLISALHVSVNTEVPTNLPNDYRSYPMSQSEVERYLLAHRHACDHLLSGEVMLGLLSAIDRQPDPLYGDRAVLRLLTVLVSSGGFKDPVTGPEVSAMSSLKLFSMPPHVVPDIR